MPEEVKARPSLWPAMHVLFTLTRTSRNQKEHNLSRDVLKANAAKHESTSLLKANAATHESLAIFPFRAFTLSCFSGQLLSFLLCQK